MRYRLTFWVLHCTFKLWIFFGSPAEAASPHITAYHPYSCVSNYFVNAANGNDSNDGTTPVTAWQTLGRADHDRVAGDCINVAPGTYYQPGNTYHGLTLRSGGNSNSPTGYVVWVSTTPHAAKITGSSGHKNLVGVYRAAYIIFDGFEIDANGIPGNGFIAGDADHSDHHIMVLNNIVHNAGAAGISLNFSEFYTVFGNIVYNNQFTNQVRSSGISIYEPTIASYTPTTTDTSSYYHIIIMNNISHGNIYKVPGVKHSDGNGIILDDSLDTQNEPHVRYTGQTLIQNNFVFANGGKGIALFYSQNVDVYNNTAYGNNQDKLNFETLRGEIWSFCSINVKVIGNIGYAVPNADDSRKTNAAFASGQSSGCAYGVRFDKNISYPAIGPKQFFVAHDLIDFVTNNLNGTDPKFVAAPNSLIPTNVAAFGTGVTNPNVPQKGLSCVPMKSPPNIGAIGCRR